MQQSEWAREDCLCGVVLRAVFSWLSGVELARAGAACRAWRRAAAQPALWRALLAQHHPALHQSCSVPRASTEGARWRQLYVECAAGWAPAGRRALHCGGAVLHAALAPHHEPGAPRHHVLAVCADSAELAVWRVSESGGEWCVVWREALCARGWASARRVCWAPRGGAGAGRRLLVSGALALCTHTEMLVVRLHGDWSYGGVLCRVVCAAGGAGCWLDAARFVSLEVSELGPALSCTTVWLNSASQETQSERAGVRSPVLRLFNEDDTRVTHVCVCGGVCVVMSCGAVLCAWRVCARVSPVEAGGGLAERAQLARQRRAAPPPAPAPPTEREVRALCTPPAARCPLPAPVVGLEIHPSGAWLCAVCAGGAVLRVCAATLSVQGAWSAPPPARPLVQPSLSDTHVCSPAGGGVCVWRGAGLRPTWLEGGGGRDPVAALLTRRVGRAHLLVLAGDTLHEWRSRASSQCDVEYV